MNDSPLMTLYIISYNHERFIRDAVVSALNQDYKNLEIIISDDCSTDNTFKIIHETVEKYNGPHKIVLNRNKKNMGVVEHNNFIVLNLVNTQYFVAQAGDDISMPNRVTKISQYLQENSDVYALCSNAKIINEINEEGGLFISQGKFSEKKKGFQ